MPAFFFHLRTPDGLDLSEDGLEFPDLDIAYLQACDAVPGLAAEFIEQGKDPFQYSFVIAGAQGDVLMEVPFAERLRGRRRVTLRGQGVRARRLSRELAEMIDSARQTVQRSREILARARTL